MMDEDSNYYVVYGKRKPIRLSKGGVKQYLGGEYNLLDEKDSRVSKIVKVPSKYTADQARFIMKQTDPKYSKLINVVYDKKANIKHMELTRSNKLKKIKQEFDPSNHFIQIFDSGNEYNWNDGELRKKTGCATESIETYDLDKLSNPEVEVYERGSSVYQGSSKNYQKGMSCVQKGKRVLKEKL